MHPLALILCLLATAPQDPQDAPAGKADPRDAPGAQSPLAPPSPRDARMVGVGGHVANATARDLYGAERGWRSGRGEKATVIALTSITCPLCRKFGPSLARVEAAYRERGVKFVFVNVSGTDAAPDMRKQVADLGFKGLYLDD